MKLSDYKGEQALDMLAELVEPAAAIMSDPNVAAFAKSGKPLVKLLGPLIKNHKPEIIEILAILDGETPEVYAEKVNIFTLPLKLVDLLNDPALKDLFTSQGQKTQEESSGSATATTEEKEQ